MIDSTIKQLIFCTIYFIIKSKGGVSMKKLLAMLMSFLFIVISVPVSAYGANEKTKTVIELKSNIASCTYEDYEKFALIKSDGVVFDESQRYGGNREHCSAGRRVKRRYDRGRHHRRFIYRIQLGGSRCTRSPQLG